MQFLFVSDFSADRGTGAAGTLIAVAEALERLGHRVDLVWKLELPYRFPHPGVQRLFELPARQLHQVAHLLSTNTYDVVSVSQPYAYRIFEELVPQYPNTLFLNRTHGWEARLYESHLRFKWDALSSPRRLATRVGSWLTGRACRRTAQSCHGIVTASSRCAEHIRSHYALGAQKVTHIPYGLDADFLDIPDREFVRDRGPRILFVGNYVPLKGTRILEAVLPELAQSQKTASITFVVDTAGTHLVEAAYRSAFEDRLTVCAWLDREGLRAVYSAHDVFLFLSLFEGFGKTWMEAMATGMCVVGFAEGGLPDIARHGHEALYTMPGNTDGFRTLLYRVLSSPVRAYEIGRLARQCCQQYTWDRTAQATVEYCVLLRASLNND